MNTKKAAKNIVKLGAGAAIGYFGFGAALYAGLLSKVMVNRNHKHKTLTETEINRFTKHPELLVDPSDWYAFICPEQYSMISKRGERLHASIIRQPEKSNKWVIICHGWTNWPEGMCRYAKGFYDLGFNILLPNLSGHALSEHKHVTMGWDDRLDIVDWANLIALNNEGCEIVLHGMSMGAATVMMTTGEELPDNVKCAVEDCGFTSLHDMAVTVLASRTHMPPALFVSAANDFTRLFAGYKLKDVSPLEQIKKSKTPTLFIHGQADTFIPCWMMDVVYNAHPLDEKKIVYVPDANHAQSVEVHPEIYWKEIKEFTDKYLSL